MLLCLPQTLLRSAGPTPANQRTENLTLTKRVFLFLFSTQEKALQSLHEKATVCTKDLITIPERIRHALGLTNGDKVAFDWHGLNLIMIRVHGSEHEGPVIRRFLALLDSDVTNGCHLSCLPDDFLRVLLAHNKVTPKHR